MSLSVPKVVLAGVALLLGACQAGPTIQPGETYKYDTDLAVPQATVFEKLVELTHSRGLRSEEVNAGSGVLVLQPMAMTAADMDKYCRFPAIDETGEPASSFSEYDAERAREDKQAVTGSMALSFLVKELDYASSNIGLNADWSVTNGEKTVDCSSLGTFEAGMIQELKDLLLKPGN